MNTTSILPATTSNAGNTIARTNQTLDQAAFLRLMTAQLSFQDPTAPVDNQAMVAQLAQFSSVAGISESNSALRRIADQLTTQTRLLQDIRAATVPTTTTQTI